ncbi:EamA-like transporter family protein [compost metagenome]
MKANVAMSSSQVKRERYGLAFGMCAAVIWGGYLAVTRQGIAAGLTAADLSFLRYSTAGLIMLSWLLRHNPLRLGGIGWGKGSALALLAGPPFVLVGASGFSYAPLAHSAVIQLGTLTLMGIALSVIMIGERTSKRRLAGVAIILTGLAVTAGPALLDGRSDAWKGDLLFATAGSMWALFTVLQLRWRIPPLTATAVVSVLSGLVYSLFYLSHYGLSNLMRADTSMLIQQALVLGVLSGVVALFTFSRTVEYLGAARASLFPAFAPAIAILIGIPLTNEIPTLWQMVGLVILSAGLLLAIQAPKAGSPTPP